MEKKYEFPNLEELFQRYDKELRYYHLLNRTDMTKEEFAKEKEKLYRVAQKIGTRELMTLYYIQELKEMQNWRLFYKLRDCYRAQRALYEELEPPKE